MRVVVVEHPLVAAALTELRDVVHGEITEFEIMEAERARNKLRLREVSLVSVNAKHPSSTATLHLTRVKARITADIKNALTAEIVW